MPENISEPRIAPRCRPATPEDGPSIGRIVVAAWQVAYADLIPSAFLETMNPVAVQKRWEREALPAREFQRVITVGGEVMGACSGGSIRGDEPVTATAELYSLNVHPEHWGQGLGAALLRCAEAAMQDRGFSSAILWVLSGNTRAQRFYSAAGWQPDGTERTTTHRTGTPLHELRFRRGSLARSSG